MAELQKCQGCFASGAKCIYNASWTHSTGVFCKRHAPAGSEPMDNARTTKPKAKVASTPEQSNAMYEAIMARVKIGDVPSDPRFGEFAKMSRPERQIVIRRASEMADKPDDPLYVGRVIPEAVSQYGASANQRHLPLEIGMHRLRSLGAQWDSDQRVDIFGFEEGNLLTFPDVNMKIANCSAPYLAYIKKTFEEYCKGENVVYMGPKGVVTRRGGPVPVEDSEWYIELPSNVPLRDVHNRMKVGEITKAIDEGKDSAQRYLSLVGKTLVCLCAPYPCHCEVYVWMVRLLNRRAAAKQ